MRSASSLAFFSASSKSIRSAEIFLTPSLAAGFLAPRMPPALRGPLVVVAPGVVFLRAAEVVIRLAAGAAGVEASESFLESGEAVRWISLPLPRSGEAVRPMTGGVEVREMGGVGFLMAGLSHEEKKSSSGSPAGVLLPVASSPSVMTTSSGYLDGWKTAR